MKNHHCGSVFIYAIIISFFAAIIGYMVILKMDILIHNLDYQEYDAKLHANIREKATLAIEYDKSMNNNSGGSLYDNDNFYYTNSTGSTDDDDLGRKMIYGYVKKNNGWYNILNINQGSRDSITKNILNSGSVSIPMGFTQTGYIRFDIDNPFTLKVIEFNRTIFESIKKLQVLTGSTITSSYGGVGWIMPDLSLSGTSLMSSRKVFDFKNHDYSFFLSFSGNLTSPGVDFLKYKITMENDYGSGLYIVPLDDSGTGIIRYLGSDIIIDQENNYQYKEFEVVRSK